MVYSYVDFPGCGIYHPKIHGLWIISVPGLLGRDCCEHAARDRRSIGRRPARRHLLANTAEKIYFIMIWGSLLRAAPRDPAFELVNLLYIRRGYGASDPADHVFSLLGIATDLQGTFKPDYKKSWEETFLSATRYLLESRHDLRVLSAVDTDGEDNRTLNAEEMQRKNTNLPSWVPDWRCQLPVWRCFTNVRRCYAASGTTKLHQQTSDDRSRLLLRGFKIDTVSSAGIHHDKPSQPFLDRSVWSKMAGTVCVNGRYRPTGEKLDLAFARTLLVDRVESLQNVT